MKTSTYNFSLLKTSLLIFLFTAVTLKSFPACVTAPSGLVSWWKAENNPSDMVGGNHGVALGNTSFAGGTNGQAFIFDGNTDSILITNSPNLQLQDFTIEAWVKRSNAGLASQGSGGVGVIFGYGEGGYSLYMDSGGALYFAKLGEFGIPSALSVSDTNYHHVAVTKSGDVATFYVDGVADVHTPVTTTFVFATDVAIGARPDNFDNSFLGRIDELSVYGRALSDFEIQSIIEAGSDGKCQLPVPPQFITQPTNKTVEVGDQATFSVQASGAVPIRFQWMLNSTNIVGATNLTLTLTNIQAAQAGNYSVFATNDFGSDLSSEALLTVLSAPPCVSWPTGIVSWWRGVGNAFDHFGVNSGTLVGNTAYPSGRVGQCFGFDGAGDLVVLSNNPTMQLQSFTIEAWVKRNSSTVASFGSGGNGVLFGYGTGGYMLYMSGSGQMFLSKAGFSAVSSSWVISDTALHHLAVTKDNTNVTFYLDGTNVSTAVYNTTFTFSTGVGIGARPDNFDNSFNGLIDELSLYNRALSQPELQSIRGAGPSGKCAVTQPATFVSHPTNRAVIPGTNTTFTASVGGTPPFIYQWRWNGVAINGATNSSLTLSNVQPQNAGAYSLFVTNAGSSALSSNATLKVNVITATGNGQPLTNTSHSFGGAVTVQLTTAYTNGFIFYTLDGSTPSFSSSQYAAPFVITQSKTLRAIGYSADFLNAGEFDAVQILIVPSFSLTSTNAGGGSVAFNPTGGNYLSNTTVTVTATPLSGWVFMQWLGDASGTNPVTSISMNRSKAIQPVFGTTFNTTAAGGGSVTSTPSAGTYPYGTVIRLSAIPQAGNYFALWGNAASGNTNPLNFTLTTANPTASSLFAAVSGGQAGLTVVPVGLGQVSVSPRANLFSTGASVSITATPTSGQTFTGWSGDASGTQNPLSITMNQNKIIYANFTKKPKLTAEVLRGEGLRLTLTGDFAAGYQVETSTNLSSWTGLTVLSNITGTAQLMDTSVSNTPSRLYRARLLP